MLNYPKKIIISRTDSIGDVMLTLPLAGLLKKIIDGCEIIFLCHSYTKAVVSCCSNVDKIICWDEICKKSFSEQIEIFKEADCIIHVFPNKNIAKLAKLARIPLRIGTSHRFFHWTTCNKLISLSRKKSSLHEAQLNFVLARTLGAKFIYSLEEIIALQNFEAQKIEFSIKNYIDNEKFNLVLHPKSKGSGREWGVSNFAKLIEILPAEKFKIFITGSQAEGELIFDTLVKPYSEKVTDLTGKLSLEELIAFLALSDGLVAAGTGPLHIAAALGIHVIGIFPPIPPIHPARWAPIGKQTKVFVTNKECNYCKKSLECKCMKEVKPSDIAEYLYKIQINNKKRI
ncbi:MAG: glycosyltransferase family 9 protein [Bacteroidales bacterium]|jgi:ADP-heptose:LPS heptosyltransferase|nr:glycosyltransferase family 9 protein [Bacteroidales bacterium]